MTSSKDQIQALIAEIDSVLQKTTPRLPWRVMSGETVQQRQVLERVRNYLVANQGRSAIRQGGGQAGVRADLLAHDIYYQTPEAGDFPEQPANTAIDPQGELTAQQMLQTVMQEMSYLRSNLMQPLQADVVAMQQQRELLLQEIRQLEAQRQGYGMAAAGNQQQMISDFMQTLLARLQETLPQQVAQTLRATPGQPLPYATNPLLAAGNPYQTATPLPPAQPSADQLVVNLDSTLKVVFESLERNVQAYQESLAQGLERMHGLGQQGEMMFSALVNHLAQQLGREASVYLQTSNQVVDLPDTVAEPTPIGGNSMYGGLYGSMPATQVAPNSTIPDSSLPRQNPDLDLRLPFPGTELSTIDDSDTPVQAEPVLGSETMTTGVDAAIDDWLRSASANINSYAGAEFPDLGVADLNNLDLNQLSSQDIDALLQVGIVPPPAAEESASLSIAAPEPELPTVEEDTADIDAALKLLEQLSTELPDEPTAPSLEDAEAEIDRMLATVPPTGEMSSPTDLPEDARDELDEFYESLFGGESGVDLLEDQSDTGMQVSLSPGEAIAPLATAAPIAQPPLPVTEPLVEPIAPEAAIVPPATETLNDRPAALDPTLGWELPTDYVAPEPLSEAVAPLLFTEDPVAAPEVEPSDTEALSIVQPAAELAPEQEVQEITGPSLVEPEPASIELPAEPVADDINAVFDQINSLTDLFAEDTFGDTTAFPEVDLPPATDTETQAIFDQALGDVPTAPVLPTSPVGLDQPLEMGGEDRYTPASPEENLLPLGTTPEPPRAGIWFDEMTLSSLDEDLFSLENAGQTRPAQPSVPQTPIDLDTGSSAAPVNSDYPSLEELAALLPSDAPPPMTVVSPLEGLIPTAPIDPTAATSNSFTLEGMGNLFGETPIAPPSPPAATPVPPLLATEPTAFTLEGMDDLFADLPSSPSVSPAVPPNLVTSEPPDLTVAASAPSIAAPASDQLAAFTLEGMDDLFADVPAVTVEAAVAPGPPVDNSPFTLDNITDLFADTSQATDLPSSSTGADSYSSVASAPPPAVDFLSSSPGAAIEAATPVDRPSDFTIAQVGDVLMEMPIDSLRDDSPLTPELVAEPLGDFTLEQMGDLFVEVPTTSMAADNLDLEPEPTPLSLFDLGQDLGLGVSGNIEPIPESLLTEAFESFMGTEPIPPIDLIEPGSEDSQAGEKKKQT